jgi:SAM-dependent methyltransferase
MSVNRHRFFTNGRCAEGCALLFSMYVKAMLTIVTYTILSIHMPPKYMCSRSAPYHPCIHIFGNVGFPGRIHAHGAELFTRTIDQFAYNGMNMRFEVAQMIALRHPLDSNILEIGCGVGTLTNELEKCGLENIVALDTSQEMLDVAMTNTNNVTFYRENGVDSHTLDFNPKVAIVCMVMHEMPEVAHRELLSSLCRATKDASGEIWIVDIHPSYEPSWSMLTGEPYILTYLANIDRIVEETAVELNMSSATIDIIAGRVRGWVVTHREGLSVGSTNVQLRS